MHTLMISTLLLLSYRHVNNIDFKSPIFNFICNKLTCKDVHKNNTKNRLSMTKNMEYFFFYI